MKTTDHLINELLWHFLCSVVPSLQIVCTFVMKQIHFKNTQIAFCSPRQWMLPLQSIPIMYGISDHFSSVQNISIKLLMSVSWFSLFVMAILLNLCSHIKRIKMMFQLRLYSNFRAQAFSIEDGLQKNRSYCRDDSSNSMFGHDFFQSFRLDFHVGCWILHLLYDRRGKCSVPDVFSIWALYRSFSVKFKWFSFGKAMSLLCDKICFFFCLRFPFEWRSSIGFLVALFMTSIFQTNELFFMSCVFCAGIIFYMFMISLINDLKYDLNSFREMIKSKRPQEELLKSFCHLLQFHSKVKRFDF